MKTKMYTCIPYILKSMFPEQPSEETGENKTFIILFSLTEDTTIDRVNCSDRSSEFSKNKF